MTYCGKLYTVHPYPILPPPSGKHVDVVTALAATSDRDQAKSWADEWADETQHYHYVTGFRCYLDHEPAKPYRLVLEFSADPLDQYVGLGQNARDRSTAPAAPAPATDTLDTSDTGSQLPEALALGLISD